MEEKRMTYRDYKRHYANCETVRGSYDASSKTIIVLVPVSMMQPKRSASRFDSKRGEKRGPQKKLRGYRVAVRQYNQGRDASYLLEAWGGCLRLPPWGAARARSQQDNPRLWPIREGCRHLRGPPACGLWAVCGVTNTPPRR